MEYWCHMRWSQCVNSYLCAKHYSWMVTLLKQFSSLFFPFDALATSGFSATGHFLLLPKPLEDGSVHFVLVSSKMKQGIPDLRCSELWKVVNLIELCLERQLV